MRPFGFGDTPPKRPSPDSVATPIAECGRIIAKTELPFAATPAVAGKTLFADSLLIGKPLAVDAAKRDIRAGKIIIYAQRPAISPRRAGRAIGFLRELIVPRSRLRDAKTVDIVETRQGEVAKVTL